jgi:hypothetical protein
VGRAEPLPPASAPEPLGPDRRLRDPDRPGAPVVDDEQPGGGGAGRSPGPRIDSDCEDAAVECADDVVLAIDHELRIDRDKLKHLGGNVASLNPNGDRTLAPP